MELSHPLSNLKKYNIILASHSPRRQELLKDLDLEFSVKTIEGIDETYPPTLPIGEVAEYLSRKKAEAYNVTENELVITADTVVILGDEIMGKPVDEADASRMLRALSGHKHCVITGVTVKSMRRQRSFSVSTDVEFAPLSEAEIQYYVHRYRPMDKAGAYGIQEWIGCCGIKGIDGSFYNVMGLPVFRLYQELKQF